MAGQKVTPLWDQDVDYPKLRKPAALSKTENAANDSTVSNLENIVQKSNLSVDAKEFVPASFNIMSSSSTSSTQHSVQNRLNKYKPVENNYNEITNSYQFNVLFNSIELLTVKPGKFDIVIPTLLEHLDPYFGNVDAMSKITEIIFTQVCH